ncbi:MAG: hypothetical protein ACFFBS_06030 [Promethearchaeota archaeon]
MGKSEERTVMGLISIAVIISGSLLFYAVVTSPPREGFPTISVLNQDLLAVGLMQADNASQFLFHVLVQNYLGHVGYFLVDVWMGQITGETNPPLNSCTHWGNISRIIVDRGEHMFPINDMIHTTQPVERYIYYCILYVFNVNIGEFEYVRNALGETTTVWMQVNITA